MLYTVCFSPTGGTKRAAGILMDAFKTEGKWIDLNNSNIRKSTYTFNQEDLVIAAVPVYGGQIPLADSLLSHLKGNQTPCILLACYGNRHYDDALAQMKKQMTNQGFLPIGGAAVVIPHVFSDKLGADRPNQQDQKILIDFSKKIKEKLSQQDYTVIEVPGHPEIRQTKSSSMPRTVNMQLCVHCGLCAEVCPADAIDPDTLEFHQDKCLNCMACKTHCAQHAISFDYHSIQQFLDEKFSKPRDIELFL